MIEKNISLLSLATAVYMDEDCPAVGIILTVFLVKGIYLVTTLLKTLYLIQRDRIAHASLPFAVRQVRIVSNTVFGILNDDMNFRPFLHQVTCQAKSDVVSIFVFVKFVLPYPSDSSGIGSAMSADDIKASTCKAVGSDFDICQFLSKQRFFDSGSYFSRFSFGRSLLGSCTFSCCILASVFPAEVPDDFFTGGMT